MLSTSDNINARFAGGLQGASNELTREAGPATEQVANSRREHTRKPKRRTTNFDSKEICTLLVDAVIVAQRSAGVGPHDPAQEFFPFEVLSLSLFWQCGFGRVARLRTAEGLTDAFLGAGRRGIPLQAGSVFIWP